MLAALRRDQRQIRIIQMKITRQIVGGRRTDVTAEVLPLGGGEETDGHGESVGEIATGWPIVISQ